MYTRAELQVLVHNFETKTLPKEAWTHEAHLAVGLWYAVTAPENMLARLRQNIRTYNAAVGGQNTETAGYHETITDFYVRLLIGCAKARPHRGFSASTVRFSGNTLRRPELPAYVLDEGRFIQPHRPKSMA